MRRCSRRCEPGTAAKLLPVAVWLDVDISQPRPPSGRASRGRVAGRPAAADTLEQARALRAELWEARQAVYAAAAESLSRGRGGGRHASPTSAPRRPSCSSTCRRRRRSTGGGPRFSASDSTGVANAMSSAGETVDANWTGGAATRATESAWRWSSTTTPRTPATWPAGSSSVQHDGRIVTHVHPTWVAGAIASQNWTWRGVAPGAGIVTAGTGDSTPGLSTDRAIIAAADWAMSPERRRRRHRQHQLRPGHRHRRGRGAPLLRLRRLGGRPAGRRGSGNFSTFGNWNVVSPGTGYNVLTVGGVNDRNTGGTRRRHPVVRIERSELPRPRRTSWNPHGDYNKPNLSAPAVSVRTANGTIGDGTSVASPIVAGIAAQLIARAPTLATWPEATRAILMAGAVRRTPMPGGGLSRDHEGVGTASARWSNRVLDKGPYGGWMLGTMTAGQVVTRDIPVVAGPAGARRAGVEQPHVGNLEHRQDRRPARGSRPGDPPAERDDDRVVLVRQLVRGGRRDRVEHRDDAHLRRARRFDASQEPYGLAWALTEPLHRHRGSKYYGQILWVAQRSIMAGCTSTRFCPDGSLTRGQLAKSLAEALDLPPTGTDYYSDDESSRFEGAINRLAAAGLTGGCGGGKYCPGQMVRRGGLATALARALHLPATGTDYFTDDDSSPHEANINRLAAAGIGSGCDDRRYCPDVRVSRELATVFLRRAFD